jgi:hypothetical protein
MIGSWRAIDQWPELDAEVVANEVVQTVVTRRLTIKQNTLLSPRCEPELSGVGRRSLRASRSFHNLFSVQGNSSRPSRFYTEEASSLFTTVGLVSRVCLQNSGDYPFWRNRHVSVGSQ